MELFTWAKGIHTSTASENKAQDCLEYANHLREGKREMIGVARVLTCLIAGLWLL